MKNIRQINKAIIVDDVKGSLITYYPNWLPFQESIDLFDKLLATLPLTTHEVFVAGRFVKQPRLSSWHGDENRSYTYSGLTVHPKPWTAELSYLRDKLKEFLNISFNSVLVNYYRDGNDSISKHSDSEESLGPTEKNKVIASISFGEARNFVIKHKETGDTIELPLQYGSLLVMAGTTQRFYTHEIPKTKKPIKPRLNLTYRVII